MKTFFKVVLLFFILCIVFFGYLFANKKPHRDWLIVSKYHILDIYTAVDMYKIDFNSLPDSNHIWWELEENYKIKNNNDYWGNEYIYKKIDNSRYSVYSSGPNGLDDECRLDDICLDKSFDCHIYKDCFSELKYFALIFLFYLIPFLLIILLACGGYIIVEERKLKK